MSHPRETFVEYFGPPGPTHLVRAPGRVNLMGDHVDYVGLSVLPMAIARHVTLAVRARDDATVRVANTDPAFPPREFEVSPVIEPGRPGDWGNYLNAAAQGVATRYGPLRGADLLVAADLPAAAGLSSSSALVVAGALALLEATGRTVERVELAEVLAEAERYVGTQGGGMDQAICLAAREGEVCRIDFDPLRLTYLPMPDDWRVVVASSLVRASKSESARAVYNQRTAECREALAAVVDYLGLTDVGSYADLLAHTGVARLLDAAAALPDNLRPRFGHVTTEAVRVRDAEGVLRLGDLGRFGRLMLASHASLRDDFAVSCAELDTLVEIATGAGAAGARLTGAGSGGCIVALTDAEGVAAVTGALREAFYAPRGVDDTDHHLFVARPAAGATVEVL